MPQIISAVEHSRLMSEVATLHLVPISNVTVLRRCTYAACGLLILLVLVLSHSSVGMSCDLINGKKL